MTDPKELADDLETPCTCSHDYTSRGRRAPDCTYHEFGPDHDNALTQVMAFLRSLEDRGVVFEHKWAGPGVHANLEGTDEGKRVFVQGVE